MIYTDIICGRTVRKQAVGSASLYVKPRRADHVQMCLSLLPVFVKNIKRYQQVDCNSLKFSVQTLY